jgi:hypothetical protein
MLPKRMECHPFEQNKTYTEWKSRAAEEPA